MRILQSKFAKTPQNSEKGRGAVIDPPLSCQAAENAKLVSSHIAVEGHFPTNC